MAMNWLQLLLTAVTLPPLCFIAYTITGLVQNYRDARKLGCPIRMIPISPLNPLWFLIDDRVLSYVRRLPFGLGDNSFTRYNFRCWEVKDRYRSHQEMGDIWVLVTPYKNWLFLNDPDAIMAHYKRANDFPRPLWTSDVLGVFGPSIAVSVGERWKTQRRLVTRCFNEKNNELVWKESLSQAQQMLQNWSSKTSNPHIDRDLRALSLHVISRAGFGKSFPFHGYEEKQAIRAGQPMDYREAIGIILEHCVLLLGLGPNFLSVMSKIWLPKKLHILQDAVMTFQKYMTSLYEDTKRLHTDNEASDNNLMTMLVRASQDAGADGGLTESEIYGNMFVLNFAGHDTTAHTFTFAMYFLAANPAVQDWLSEEINAVLNGRQFSELDYRADSLRFKRCLAVMHESLRLYTIVPTIRWTGDKSTTINVNGKDYFVPKYTCTLPSYGSIQSDPRIWGNDSLKFKPSRWIVPKEGKSTPGDEDFLNYKRGTFLGWSEGNRDCPGRKFSQIEFVATLAVLFAQHRVEPVRQPGETAVEAQKRINHLIEHDSGPVLLLQMLHPERAPLLWKRVAN